MTAASFRLIERKGPNPGATYELTKEISLMGRDVANDIVLNDPEISRQHSRMTRTPGGYVLEDLGSTNGTFVNGERLVAPRVLNPGDLVGLGENVNLTFDSSSPESAATVMAPVAEEGEPESMRTSVEPGAPPMPARPPSSGTPPMSPPAMDMGPPMDSEPTDRRRWIFAGCGCLILLGLCGGVFYVMDAFYPDILYAPLRILGFN